MHPNNQSQVEHIVGLGRILVVNLLVIAVILTFHKTLLIMLGDMPTTKPLWLARSDDVGVHL